LSKKFDGVVDQVAEHISNYEKSVTESIKALKAPAEKLSFPTERKLIAKRDFVIKQNEFYLEIKTGDDLSEVPKLYLENLKTEQVI